jgi:AcrR family transcriptional regulator
MTNATAINNGSGLHQARRAAVLKAARKVFEAKGLDGASIRLIAKAARCTTGSIYPYFKGKEEIYAEVLSRSLDEYKNDLIAAIAARHDAKSRFEAALMAHFDFYEQRPSDMSLALYLFNGLKPQGLTKELDTRLNAQLSSILAVFGSCVRDLADVSERETEAEVGLHLAMLFGLLTLHHTRRTRVFRVDARTLLDLHIRRWLECRARPQVGRRGKK